jgi:hypothetical protein
MPSLPTPVRQVFQLTKMVLAESLYITGADALIMPVKQGSPNCGEKQ